MIGYWICFAFLTTLVTPSMQEYNEEEEGTYMNEEEGTYMNEEEGTYMNEEEGTYMNEKEWVYLDEGNGNCGDCGASGMTNVLIVHGQIVHYAHNYPWMVAVNVNGVSICGGTIISENFILTASHCIKRPDISQKLDITTCVFQNGRNGPCYFNQNEVRIQFMTKTSELSAGLNVADVIAHPYYQPDKHTVEHDIALIRMSRAIQCGKYAAPICLPNPTMQPRIGMVMGIAGWGETMNLNERGDARMRMTNIQVVNDAYTCRKLIGYNPQSSICLSGKGSSSPCFGDSGGPAYFQMRNKFYVMGVASAHSSTNCATTSPVVYTSVSNYMPWIRKVTGMNF